MFAKNKKQIIILVVANSFIIFAATFLIMREFQSRRPEPTLPLVEERETLIHETKPLSMRIAKIGLSAEIEEVGKTTAGNMAVPKGYDMVGWYKYGAAPGEIGNAVFAGHVDNGRGKPAIFARLKELAIGDQIEVTTEDAEKIVFKVVGMKLLPYNSEPQTEIFGPSQKARLNLITCNGEWINSLKTYSDRLVVFTEQI